MQIKSYFDIAAEIAELKSRIILLEKPLGAGDFLELRFIDQKLNNNACFCTSSSKDTKTLEKTMSQIFGRKDFSSLYWIDLENSNAGRNVINCDMFELFTFDLALMKFFNANKNASGVINMLTPALTAFDEIFVYKFFSDMISTMRQYDTSIIFTLTKDFHSDNMIQAIEKNCDSVIDLEFKKKAFEDFMYLHFKKMDNKKVKKSYQVIKDIYT